jgi:hypothetical protein
VGDTAPRIGVKSPIRRQHNSLRAKEESTLLEASFELLDDAGLLWEKNGIYYGRQAALQKTLRELQEDDGAYLFDRA